MDKRQLMAYLNAERKRQLYLENSNLTRIKIYPFVSQGEFAKFSGTKNDSLYILRVDDTLLSYYSWFLEQKGIFLIKPKNGAHISYLYEKECSSADIVHLDKKLGKVVDFYYGDLVTNGVHWWLEVHCPHIEATRTVMGLTPRPKSGLHVTIGKIK